MLAFVGAEIAASVFIADFCHASPPASTRLTLPAVGGSQHSFAPSEAMVRCSPAQLVALMVA